MLKGMNRYLRYGIIFAGMLIAVSLIKVVLDMVFGLRVGSGTSFVVPMVMGLLVGQWYFENGGTAPSGSERWGDAMRFGALGVLISLVMTAIVLPFVGGMEMFAAVGPVGGLIILVILMVLFILSTRVGIWLGVRTTLNAQAVKAGK